MAELILHPGRDRSLRRRHPWVLSGAVARVEGEPEPGAWVGVRSAEGEVLGHGHFSPRSTIRARLLAFGKEDPGEGLLEERIRASLARRRGDPLLDGSDALRLVNAEGDGLPGLVVDRYAEALAVRLTTAGMDRRRERVAAALREATGAACALERPDAQAARREGLAAHHAPLWGTAPSGPVAIEERGRRYQVDLRGGQKTGFYLDQRDARDLVELLAEGRRVLDLFAYTGGFSAAAARGGAAALTAVESSAEAADRIATHVALQAPGAGAAPTPRVVQDDAFRFLRRDEAEYDLLVLDPPPLARRRADVPKAARALKDLVLHALRRAAPEARVLVFRCSHSIDTDLFRKIVFGASLDARRPLQLLRSLSPPVDHPVSLDHPEGEYLSGLLLRLAP